MIYIELELGILLEWIHGHFTFKILEKKKRCSLSPNLKKKKIILWKRSKNVFWPSSFPFCFLSVRGLLFFLHLSRYKWGMDSRLLPIGSHKVCFCRWSRQVFQLNPGTFSLTSFFFWLFSFMHFKRLPQLLECLICSIHTLILLARIFPLTCLQQCQW